MSQWTAPRIYAESKGTWLAPILDRLFLSFAGLTSTQEIPAAEKMRGRQFRLLARPGQESRQRGGEDRRAWSRPYF